MCFLDLEKHLVVFQVKEKKKGVGIEEERSPEAVDRVVMGLCMGANA